jgi:hypothetical protein
MATRKFKFKHIAASASTHVGDAGELVLDTATNTLKVLDGSTPGGVTLNTDGTSGVSFTSKTADFDVTVGVRYAVDTSSNTVEATLPASPGTGNAVYFADAGGSFNTNNLTVGRNGNTIMGLSEDLTVNTNNQSFGLVYNGSDWRVYQ